MRDRPHNRGSRKVPEVVKTRQLRRPTVASPQLENGYIRIATEFIDVLCSKGFFGSEWRTIMTIIRQTWGFNKKMNAIPFSVFCSKTGMDKKSVIRTLRALELKNVIVITRPQRGVLANIYAIQKDYSRWVVAPTPPVEGVAPTPQGGGTHATARGGTPHRDRGGTHATLYRHTNNKQLSRACAIKEKIKTNINTEIETLQKLGWDQQKIKSHLVNTQQIPEAEIDVALGKIY